jgi:hypothetical protein
VDPYTFHTDLDPIFDLNTERNTLKSENIQRFITLLKTVWQIRIWRISIIKKKISGLSIILPKIKFLLFSLSKGSIMTPNCWSPPRSACCPQPSKGWMTRTSCRKRIFPCWKGGTPCSTSATWLWSTSCGKTGGTAIQETSQRNSLTPCSKEFLSGHSQHHTDLLDCAGQLRHSWAQLQCSAKDKILSSLHHGWGAPVWTGHPVYPQQNRHGPGKSYWHRKQKSPLAPVNVGIIN